MNWLRMAQGSPGKPMALPNVEVPSNNRGFEGIYRIDDTMTEETVEKLRQNYPELEQLGNMNAGSDGVVYECEPGVMCKITAIGEEFQIAQRIMEVRPSGAVPIINAYQIQEEQPSADGQELYQKLWVIQMVKVEMLNYRDMFVYGHLTAGHSGGFTDGTLNDWAVQEAEKEMNRVVGIWNRNIGNPGYETVQPIDTAISPEEIQRMNQLKVEMMQSLKGAGITSIDIPNSAANVGWYEDRLVAFDFSREYIR